MSHIKHLKDIKEYKSLIGTTPCVVKFTATWCGPCRKLSPLYEKLSMDNGDTINFLEINIDDALEITDFENVQSIPLIVFYNNGEKVENLSTTGYNPSKLETNISSFSTQVSASKLKQEKEQEPEKTPNNKQPLDVNLDKDSENLENKEHDSNDEYGQDFEIPIEKTVSEDLLKDAN